MESILFIWIWFVLTLIVVWVFGAGLGRYLAREMIISKTLEEYPYLTPQIIGGKLIFVNDSDHDFEEEME